MKKLILTTAMICFVASVLLIGYSIISIMEAKKYEKEYLELWYSGVYSKDTPSNEVLTLNPSGPAAKHENNKDLICVINFPDINKRVPVLIGSTDNNLTKGAAWNTDSVKPGEVGDCLIFGHRDTSFNFLKDISIGNNIIVDTGNRLVEFTVTDTTIINPDNIKLITVLNKPTIRLITCYPFNFFGHAPKRFVVTASAK